MRHDNTKASITAVAKDFLPTTTSTPSSTPSSTSFSPTCYLTRKVETFL